MVCDTYLLRFVPYNNIMRLMKYTMHGDNYEMQTDKKCADGICDPLTYTTRSILPKVEGNLKGTNRRASTFRI
jgi:hypothetical protein